MRKLTLVCMVAMFTGCNNEQGDSPTRLSAFEQSAVDTTTVVTPKVIDWQGHRGCRGLMPENTIPAFLYAIDLGVHTLEMDVVITADHQVVVSHEPFFSHEISTAPDSSLIEASEERNFNIYKMNYADVRRYDVGLRAHPRFPKQMKMRVEKPRLRDVIASVKHYCDCNGMAPVRFNIETKSNPETDNEFHPTPDVFARLVWKEIKESDIVGFTTVQSFDPRTLQYLKENGFGGELALLVDNLDGFEANINTLGFDPDIYSCNHQLVDSTLVNQAHAKNIKVIPWTVNTTSEMKMLLDIGVDGIITDYPDRIPSY